MSQMEYWLVVPNARLLKRVDDFDVDGNGVLRSCTVWETKCDGRTIVLPPEHRRATEVKTKLTFLALLFKQLEGLEQLREFVLALFDKPPLRESDFDRWWRLEYAGSDFYRLKGYQKFAKGLVSEKSVEAEKNPRVRSALQQWVTQIGAGSFDDIEIETNSPIIRFFKETSKSPPTSDF